MRPTHCDETMAGVTGVRQGMTDVRRRLIASPSRGHGGGGENAPTGAIMAARQAALRAWQTASTLLPLGSIKKAA